jgi:peroxiredoxin
MKRISLTIFISLLLSHFIWGQNTREQKIFIQLENEYFKSKLENNVKLMDGILDENFVSTNQFGHVRNRAQSLQFYKSFKTRLSTLDSIRSIKIENEKSAVVEGMQTENGNKIYFTHIYSKHESGWQILSSVQKFPEFQNLQGLGNYRLIGELKGADGMAISLMKNVGNSPVNMNVAIVKDGKFLMEGKPIEYPEMVFLTTPGKRERASFFLENSQITITGQIDSLSKVKVTGSKTQDEFSTLLAQFKPITIRAEINSKAIQSALQNKDTATVSQIKKEMGAVSIQIDNIQKEFIRNNPKSYVVPIIFSGLFNKLTIEENESILKSLDPGVARTSMILSIIERIEAQKVVSIGKKAPDFTLNNVSGVPVSLSSRIGSKLLLIDFWAAWCGPCRAENPNVVKVFEEFKSKGFDVLGVSLDRNKEDWLKAIEKDKLPWTQVSDLLYWNSAAAKLYAVQSIPANFLLDQNGIIVAQNLRGEALFNKVNELLNKK